MDKGEIKMKKNGGNKMKHQKLFSIITIALLSIAIGCSRAGEDSDDSPKRVYRINRSDVSITSNSWFMNMFSPTKAYANNYGEVHKAIYNDEDKVRKIERYASGNYSGYWEYTLNASDQLTHRVTYNEDHNVSDEYIYQYNPDGTLQQHNWLLYSNTSPTSDHEYLYTYTTNQRLTECVHWIHTTGKTYNDWITEKWIYEYEGETNRIKRAYKSLYSNPNTKYNEVELGYPQTITTERIEYSYPDGYTVRKEAYKNATEYDPNSGDASYSHGRIFTYDDKGRITSWSSFDETDTITQTREYSYSNEEGESADPKVWLEWYRLGDQLDSELDAPM